MDIKKFLKSWNGILAVMFIGIYLMYPAIRGYLAVGDASKALEVNQIQVFAGGLAVIWALKGAWERLRDKRNE